MIKALLEIKDLSVFFNAGRGQKVHAVSGVNFLIKKGETLGLVGESGCGKSTIARAIMQFLKPTAGSIVFNGERLTNITKERLRVLRPQFQMIFQNSISSLNPKQKIIDIIAAPLKVTKRLNRKAREHRALEMAASLGLNKKICCSYPSRISGGQCQRVQIARALMSDPKLLVCDEPVSSLDVSIQAQVINLLEALRKQYRLTMLFISHDLAVVKCVCDKIAVMYLGKICELAPAEDIYHSSNHPYTQALISAIPSPAPAQVSNIKSIGEMPSPINPPSGCVFHTRCYKVQALCKNLDPELIEIEPEHKVACHFPDI